MKFFAHILIFEEQGLRFLVWSLFSYVILFVDAEVKSAQGRADAVVKTADTIYVFEFKMEENATAEEALAQIDKTGYLIPYTADHRRLVKIGVEFRKEAKGLKRWVTEF